MSFLFLMEILQFLIQSFLLIFCLWRADFELCVVQICSIVVTIWKDFLLLLLLLPTTFISQSSIVIVKWEYILDELTATPVFVHTWQIRIIERNCEIPHEGPFCDLMWSDPEDIETWAVSPRGAGWLFGSRVTSEVDCSIFHVLYYIHF